MRKIIVSEFLTLDGVMEAPEEWSFQFQNEETAYSRLIQEWYCCDIGRTEDNVV